MDVSDQGRANQSYNETMLLQLESYAQNRRENNHGSNDAERAEMEMHHG